MKYGNKLLDLYYEVLSGLWGVKWDFWDWDVLVLGFMF